MDNILDIIKAYKTFLSPEDKNKEVGKLRMDICKGCPYLNSLGLCDMCGCVMKVKTMTLTSNCPINKWNAINPNEL